MFDSPPSSPAKSSPVAQKSISPATSAPPPAKAKSVIEVIPMTPAPATPAQEKRSPGTPTMAVSSIPAKPLAAAEGDQAYEIKVTRREAKAREVVEMEGRHKKQSENFDIFHAPFSTVGYFVSFVLDRFRQFVKYSIANIGQVIALLLFLAVIVALIYLDGPHSDTVRHVERFVLWYGGWVLLGFASSAGIGSVSLLFLS